MKIQKFIETIKKNKENTIEGNNYAAARVSPNTHKKLKQVSFHFNIPLTVLVNGVLNHWLKENNDAILEEKIKLLKQEVAE